MLLPWNHCTDFPALLAQRLRMGPRHAPQHGHEAPAVRLDRASLAQWEDLARRHDDGGLWVRHGIVHVLSSRADVQHICMVQRHMMTILPVLVELLEVLILFRTFVLLFCFLDLSILLNLLYHA